MSDLGYFAVGLGIGLLIVVPVFVSYRHEMALNLRRLLGLSADADDGLESADHGHTEGLSPTIVLFSIGAAALTTAYGALSGNTIFIVSGIFAMLSVLLAFLASRATRD